MGRGTPEWTEKKIAARVREGFGSGTGSAYKSWLGVRDFSSNGNSTRLWSHKLGRMMQFFSNIEKNAFLVAEFRSDFVDYQEQYPFDRSLTHAAAREFGYRHPIYPKSFVPVVMTMDAILTRKGPAQHVCLAIDCKASKALNDPRTLEKLAIAKRACAKLGLPYALVTEKSLSPPVVENIQWIRMGLPRAGEREPLPGAFQVVPMLLHEFLCQHQQSNLSTSIGKFSATFDAKNKYPPGLSLRCMKLLAWHHLIELPLDRGTLCDLLLAEIDIPGQAPVGEVDVR